MACLARFLRAGEASHWVQADAPETVNALLAEHVRGVVSFRNERGWWDNRDLDEDSHDEEPMTPLPFDVNDRAVRDRFFRHHLAEALGALEQASPPRWGAMTAQQMVEHLAWGFEISTGRATIGCTVPEARRERFKSFLRDDTPMMHEFRNPALAAGLPPLRHGGLDEGRAALAVEVARFLEHERQDPSAVHTHPVFGPITVEDWARAHFKHAHHHLLQFGLIGESRRD